MKNLKNSVLVASAFAAFALCSPAFAIPAGPVTPGGGGVRPPVVVPGDPVIGDPVPTAAEQAAYDAADEIGSRMSAAANELYQIRQATLTAIGNAADEGAEFAELQKIAKKGEKQMRSVVKTATKDMKKLFKQGSKAIKAAGGGDSLITYLSNRMSEDQGDLNAALNTYRAQFASAIENVLDRP